MFIQKLDLSSNVQLVLMELESILQQTHWHNNQIGLKHRSGAENIWHDAVGSLYDRQHGIFIAKEEDYSEWSLPETSYIRQCVTQLASALDITLGRVRIMKLPVHHGLSVHKDNERRYHLVLQTNPQSYICHNHTPFNTELQPIAQCYHMPQNNHWYRVDTRQVHWVYNGGSTERIHLVVCET